MNPTAHWSHAGPLYEARHRHTPASLEAPAEGATQEPTPLHTAPEESVGHVSTGYGQSAGQEPLRSPASHTPLPHTGTGSLAVMLEAVRTPDRLLPAANSRR